MKFKLYLAWCRLHQAISGVVGWLEKDMPKPVGLLGNGGPLPSLTDTQFLHKEGWILCMKEIQEYTQLTRTQGDQLVLIKLMEYLNRKGM
jgi:hypothetical protein